VTQRVARQAFLLSDHVFAAQRANALPLASRRRLMPRACCTHEVTPDRSALPCNNNLKTTNRNFTATRTEQAHARGAHAGNGLFRQWQHADAQAAAARHRVRLGTVADGSGVSEAEVCDALLKERRAGALAAQLLQHFGAGRVGRAEPVGA
jgi:hypothetical protein